jgi:hypothetical protein
MASITSWFSGASKDPKDASVELENRGEEPEVVVDEQSTQLLPDLTDEELERLKIEKAKKARRTQLDVILSSETSLGTTIASLKKSLRHYEKQKLDLYAQRQKYRIVVSNYKGPDNDVKLAAINKILHEDLPKLIDEMDDRIINGHAQLASLDKQLVSIKEHRLKAERAYKKLFEPIPEGDLEGGMDYDSDDSSQRGKDTPIEVILAKYDPENYPSIPPPKDPYDTSSDDEQGEVTINKISVEPILPEPHNSLASAPLSENPPRSPLRSISSTEMVDIPLD